MNASAVPNPPLAYLALEMFTPLARCWFELSRPWMARFPKGDGHAVLVLPGMLAGDREVRALNGFLVSRGYKVLHWDMGRNRGPRPGVYDVLHAKLKAEVRRSGRKVSLVGWSLGGTLARVLANRHPELVRSLVTLAAPHGEYPKSSKLNWLYTLATGQRPGSDLAFEREYMRTPELPLTAVCTRFDGVVPWHSAYQPPGLQCETVEVVSTHGAMATHPLVMYVLAERLSQPEAAWQPFRPPCWFALANGSACRRAWTALGVAARFGAAGPQAGT